MTYRKAYKGELLNVENPKTVKGEKRGYQTAVLYLAPARLSGYEVCPQRSEGCTAACLHTAGNPAYMPQKTKSRIAKTRVYFENRDGFLRQLAREIERFVAKARALDLVPCVRLNGTSDIPWERVRLDGATILEMFPEVQFYDYTKITKRALAHAAGDFPKNYHLTFSKTEDNDDDVERVARAGGNVACVVSRDLYKSALGGAGFNVWPNYDGKRRIVDGDADDLRFKDGSGALVLLKAKGDARGDTSGFTIR